MCDQKNNVLFTDTECVVLSSDYKLVDENHVLLRVLRENNMYNVDLKNVVPSGDLTCLFAKATSDESNLWHRRLGHINFKNMNKLVKVVTKNQPNHNAGIKENLDADVDAAFNVKENENEVHVSPSGSDKTKKNDEKAKSEAKGKSHVGSSIGVRDLRDEIEEFSVNSTNRVNAASAPINAVGPNPTNNTNNPSNYPDDPDMLALEDIIYLDYEEDVGTEVDLSNLETNISVSPIPTTRVYKDYLVTQIMGDLTSDPQTRSMEEGIDYDEVFAPVARIEAFWLFLAYASIMSFMVYQMDAKSAFLYGTIKEEVYVCQPPGFEDPDYPNKVYKVVKELFKAFEKLMKDKFQMSSMGEHTFFLGLQVQQKDDGIFISQDKYVAKILRKFGFTDVKSTSTHIEIEKPLLKDPDGEDVDVHIYRSMIGSLMYLTSSRLNIRFAVCTVVATSSTEAEYVAAASCCAHVLWIQNQLLDYRLTMHVKKSSMKLLEWNLHVTNVSSAGKHHTSNGYQFTMSNQHQELTSPEQTISVLIKAQQHISNESPLLGVNTARCDEDIIKLMEFMVFMFWATVSIKKANDVVKLQALIDRKKVVVTKDVIRQDLCLNDADGVECLPNEEIFIELARIGYEKPPPKLTFYKAFFSTQWKFLIHTLVQCVSAKWTAWNKFSCSIASAVICLATGRKFNFSKVGKGFLGVKTPLFASMLVQPQPQAAEEEDDVEVPAAATPPSPTNEQLPPPQDPIPTPPKAQPATPPSPPQEQPTDTSESSTTLLNTLLETCATLFKKVDELEQDKKTQALEILKLMKRVKKLEKKRRSKYSGLKRLRKVGTSQRVESSAKTIMGAQEDASKQRGRLRKDDDNAATNDVNAVEPTVFDDEEVTITMA
nr:hypothetical protein [Tanacetum cinerariifolium]